MPITSAHRGIALLGIFPDKITTDYLNVGEVDSAVRVGTRMVAVRGPEDKYCVHLDIKTSETFLDSFKKAPVTSLLSLAAHFSRPQRVYDVLIQDAVDMLREYEANYAGRGRPFPRPEDGRHFSKVPKYVRVGVASSCPTPPDCSVL